MGLLKTIRRGGREAGATPSSQPRASEITRRLSQIDEELRLLRDRIEKAVSASDDRPGGDFLIASVIEKLGRPMPAGMPAGTPTLGQVEALERERETLETELAQLREASEDPAIH